MEIFKRPLPQSFLRNESIHFFEKHGVQTPPKELREFWQKQITTTAILANESDICNKNFIMIFKAGNLENPREVFHQLPKIPLAIKTSRE